MGFSESRLRAVGVDVKALARQSKGQRADVVLPPQILTMTRYWLKLGGKSTPHWPQFQILAVAEIVPYLTIAECLSDGSFSFAFVGSAVAAFLGEDLGNRAISAATPVLGEIDWYRRCVPVSESADIQVLSGRTDPPYTSAVEFMAADFPFVTDAEGTVSHVVGVTVPRVN